MDINANKISCIIKELQEYLHYLLRLYPWRTLDFLDLILGVDLEDDNTLRLRVDVDARGSKPVTPSYDEALAQLIDKLRKKFEEVVNEGYC